MKLSIDWLKEYVNLEASVQEIADKLTMIGHEVEAIESQKDFEKVIVGQVLEIANHPNADKLHLVKVDIAGKELLKIVCGANNLKVGIKVPVILVGGKIQGERINKAVLRGVESYGMICSERELGLGDNHQGIMILDNSYQIGDAFLSADNKTQVIEVKIQPNRPDCMGIIGLARELAAALGQEIKEPVADFTKYEHNLANIEVVTEDGDICPRYVAMTVKGIKVGKSPDWLCQRLISADLRPVNNIVDIANFVMLEYGQPLHTFDLAKISGSNGCRIKVRQARDGEKIVTLDNQERKLSKEICLITNERGPIAIGGIIGGKDSEVTDQTTEVLLEAAVFDKTTIRKGSKILGFRSEAVSRFEKGLPFDLSPRAIVRTAEMIAEIAGGTVSPGMVDLKNRWSWVSHIGLKTRKLKDILQIRISNREISEILENLGCEVEEFDLVTEARKHLGKPYLFGASYKKNGARAFDCSYLVDYIYSRVGLFIGHDCLGQIHHGEEVKIKELQPGDALFIESTSTKPRDHYYVKDEENNHQKVQAKKYQQVSHVGIYLGNNQVIHAAKYDYTKPDLPEKAEKDQQVEIIPLSAFTKRKGFLGARRYLKTDQDILAVTVPWWRTDLSNQADLYEEIARIYGYDRIPASLPKAVSKEPKPNELINFISRSKQLLADIGLTEVLTYPFLTEKELETVGLSGEISLKVANPLVKGQDYIRSSNFPKILESLTENQFKEETIKFFETGRVFLPAEKKTDLPIEKTILTIATIGETTWPYQYDLGKSFYHLKGIIVRLLAKVGLEGEIDFKQREESALFGKAAADIFYQEQNLGLVGTISRKTADFYGLKKEASAAEIDLDKLIMLQRKDKTFKSFSKYPMVVRDISAIFPRKLSLGKVVQEIEHLDGPIHQVKVIDVYENREAVGERSIALRIKIWSEEKTMADKEVEEIVTKCQNKIISQGGEIRSGGK